MEQKEAQERNKRNVKHHIKYFVRTPLSKSSSTQKEDLINAVKRRNNEKAIRYRINNFFSE